jgi:hypothetical protein
MADCISYDLQFFCTANRCVVGCSICGVQSFYVPRSHPDCRAVTIYCLDPGTVDSVNIEKADGANWEQWHAEYMAKQQTQQQ